MPVLMFWNIAKGQAAPFLQELCIEHQVDVVLLAEAEDATTSVTLEINKSPIHQPFAEFAPVKSSIRLFTRYPLDRISLVSDEPRISARQIVPILGKKFLIICTHLPSKLHAAETDQHFYARNLKNVLDDAEERLGHSNSIVIGDFNMNPYELGMTALDGMNAVSDKITARKIGRSKGSQKYKFLYNPSWSTLGDESAGPPGTYFYNSPGVESIYWNAFDQVLLRPDILSEYVKFEVITKIGNTQLVSNGRIDKTISDHLPIVLELRS